MKEINYFDTPDSRRNGGGFMADFMQGVLIQREREIEELLKKIPKNYINLSDLKENYGNNQQNQRTT